MFPMVLYETFSHVALRACMYPMVLYETFSHVALRACMFPMFLYAQFFCMNHFHGLPCVRTCFKCFCIKHFHTLPCVRAFSSQRPTTPSAVFHIPAGLAIAMLIGRQGTRIDELRTKSKCVVWIEQKSELERDARTMQRVEVAGE